MANEEQLALLKAGVEVWNKWREEEPDAEVSLAGANLRAANLQEAYLSGADLREADLSGAQLSNASLTDADLSGADLWDANLYEANLIGANLSGAHLRKADLRKSNLRAAILRGAHLYDVHLGGADLWDADLSGTHLRAANLSGANLIAVDLSGADLRTANLSGANLHRADLRAANLSGANLSHSNLVGARIENAKISRGNVYGVNVWDLEGEFQEQKDLIITPEEDAPITVDNIKVAQFIYLILNNKEIRDVINTLTSKTVLILGRFTPEPRKEILDRLRDKLREYDFLPVVFDFDRPINKDFTETIKTLAGMSYFVITDVTNPKSSPLELQATVPDYQIPFVPIIQEGEKPFAMMADLRTKYNWVLRTVSYDSPDTLIEILKPLIIDPAMKKRLQLTKTKAKKPRITSGRKWKAKKK